MSRSCKHLFSSCNRTVTGKPSWARLVEETQPAARRSKLSTPLTSVSCVAHLAQPCFSTCLRQIRIPYPCRILHVSVHIAVKENLLMTTAAGLLEHLIPPTCWPSPPTPMALTSHFGPMPLSPTFLEGCQRMARRPEVDLSVRKNYLFVHLYMNASYTFSVRLSEKVCDGNVGYVLNDWDFLNFLSYLYLALRLDLKVWSQDLSRSYDELSTITNSHNLSYCFTFVFLPRASTNIGL